MSVSSKLFVQAKGCCNLSGHLLNVSTARRCEAETEKTINLFTSCALCVCGFRAGQQNELEAYKSQQQHQHQQRNAHHVTTPSSTQKRLRSSSNDHELLKLPSDTS
uniref:Uncharacterized protein n=1 Tax=Grammatophora oceanica TaxID=210454 RepID=A0A7S1UPH9_9STRA|mmetsp:Transcript_16076/g.23773  ORF Transcript_16076/g.23773 Transcript_16076/m.23773 type:complete len:106 (+) Transcript_16076:583-900(+)